MPLLFLFVLALKQNLLNANQLLVWEKKFGTWAICKSVFGMAQKIGPGQNVLGPVKGQGISIHNK